MNAAPDPPAGARPDLSEPDVTVVVVTRDTRDWTLAALESIEAGAGPLSVETILVDNGSADGTAAAAAARFPSARVIRLERNEGFARAANRALREGRGRHFLLLNSDAALEPGAVAALRDALAARPDAGAAGAVLVESGNEPSASFDAFPSFLTELGNKTLLRLLAPGRYPSKRAVERTPLDVEVLLGACLLLRREALERVGLLDERFFFYFEDADLSLRLHQAGLARILVPAARASHLRGATAYRDPLRSKKEYHLSRRLYFEKHRGARFARLLEALFTIRLAVEVAAGAALAIPALAAGLLAPRGAWGHGLRRRLRLHAEILAWRARGAPREEGLSRGGS